jgi:hypothetical protein
MTAKPSGNTYWRIPAQARLAVLPTWLRPHVRLDATSLVAEMETAGHYVVADIRRGICVFDGHVVHRSSR